MNYKARILDLEYSILGSYRIYESTDRLIDQREGAADGRANIPAIHQWRHPYWEKLKTKANADLNRYSLRLAELAAELDTAERRLKDNRDQKFVREQALIQGEFEQKRQTIERAHGHASEPREAAQAEFEESRQKLEKLEAELERPLRAPGARLYPYFMFLIAVFEVPLNIVAFQYLFRHNRLFAFAAVFAMGCFIAAAAHFIGSHIKRVSHFERMWQRTAVYASSAIAMAAVLTMFHFISVMREKYIAFVQRGPQLTEQSLLGSILNTGSGVPLTQDVFFFMNVCVFAGALVYAFVRHDAHPDYERLTGETRRLKRREERIRRTYDRKLAVVARERDARIARISKASIRLDAALYEVAEAQKLVSERQEQVQAYVELSVRQRVLSYEHANMREREDKRMPNVFILGGCEDTASDIDRDQMVIPFPPASRARRERSV